MVPADAQLVEENLRFISYKKNCETRSIEDVIDLGSSEEPRILLPISQNKKQSPIYLTNDSIGIDAEESYLEEIQLVYEESNKQVPQIRQNIETVRVLLKIYTITK
jgi:hypothetical protein